MTLKLFNAAGEPVCVITYEQASQLVAEKAGEAVGRKRLSGVKALSLPLAYAILRAGVVEINAGSHTVRRESVAGKVIYRHNMRRCEAYR